MPVTPSPRYFHPMSFTDIAACLRRGQKSPRLVPLLKSQTGSATLDKLLSFPSCAMWIKRIVARMRHTMHVMGLAWDQGTLPGPTAAPWVFQTPVDICLLGSVGLCHRRRETWEPWARGSWASQSSESFLRTEELNLLGDMPHISSQANSHACFDTSPARMYSVCRLSGKTSVKKRHRKENPLKVRDHTTWQRMC